MKWTIMISAAAVLLAMLGLARHIRRARGRQPTNQWAPEIEARVRTWQTQQARIKAEHPVLFEQFLECLFRYDPMGINFETNTDEYDPEVGTIIPRLDKCSSEQDVLNVVHEEFVRWFDDETAGPKSQYENIAAEVWQMWQDSRARP